MAAYVIGKLTEKQDSLTMKRSLVSTFLGLLVLYFVGVSYLYMIYNCYLEKAMPIYAALLHGMLVFLPADILKLIVTSILAVKISKTMKLHQR